MNVSIRYIQLMTITLINVLFISSAWSAKPTKPPGRNKSDTNPPIVTFNSQPNAYINMATASFSFSASDSGSGVNRIECSYNNAAFAVCASPITLSGLSESAHTFKIRAIDNAGNVSATQSSSFTVDMTNPVIAFTSVPASSSTNTSASFAFTVTDSSPILAHSCSLDSAAFAACSSPVNLSSLTVGDHTFRVRATDLAGNVHTHSYSFTVLEQPVVINTAEISWDFSSESELAGYRLCYGTNSGTYVNCIDVKKPTLVNGRYVYSISSGLNSGQTYYFAVKAYSITGDESAFSNEDVKSF